MLETASIAGGATIAVFLVVIICIAAYIHFIVVIVVVVVVVNSNSSSSSSIVVVVVVVVNSSSSSSSSSIKYSNCFDTVDGPGRDPELRPFSNRSRSLMIYMAKNPPNSSATIEQTRMPGWNRVETMESMRMASISESKLNNSCSVAERGVPEGAASAPSHDFSQPPQQSQHHQPTPPTPALSQSTTTSMSHLLLVSNSYGGHRANTLNPPTDSQNSVYYAMNV
ncbi:hypothetical protein HZH68_002109 [Vespula germanica]|uniref:Uncharacterized protein n=1 Tax=Vespula germanica TaxID=30212 RepID=A0A834KXH8_VESGE|nr:hypothetical protein HZH68_002109 [Vespula germanica]